MFDGCSFISGGITRIIYLVSMDITYTVDVLSSFPLSIYSTTFFCKVDVPVFYGTVVIGVVVLASSILLLFIIERVRDYVEL